MSSFFRFPSNKSSSKPSPDSLHDPRRTTKVHPMSPRSSAIDNATKKIIINEKIIKKNEKKIKDHKKILEDLENNTKSEIGLLNRFIKSSEYLLSVAKREFEEYRKEYKEHEDEITESAYKHFRWRMKWDKDHIKENNEKIDAILVHYEDKKQDIEDEIEYIEKENQKMEKEIKEKQEEIKELSKRGGKRTIRRKSKK
jgi:chromosome segregation ATPase